MKSSKEPQYHLRPHHIFCERYGTFVMPERGEDFNNFQNAITQMLNTADDAVIEVKEGPDDLCIHCPECKNNRCESPDGNEEKVRKWDSLVMQGLGINYGERRTAADFHKLVKEKAPLQFCKERCKSRDRCKVFQQNNSA